MHKESRYQLRKKEISEFIIKNRKTYKNDKRLLFLIAAFWGLLLSQLLGYQVIIPLAVMFCFYKILVNFLTW